MITINALSWSAKPAKPASPSVGSMQFPCWHVSSPFCDVIERRSSETFKNYHQHYVISRHVGGVLGDVSWQPFLFLASPWGGSIFFRREPVPYLSEFVCQIWLRYDGRVEGGGYRKTYRHTKGHCSFI